MDLVLIKYYSNKTWICGETYESLVWKDKTTEKPTEEELNIKWAELKKEQMREKRNELLKECDFKFVSDYPHLLLQIYTLLSALKLDFVLLLFLRNSGLSFV